MMRNITVISMTLMMSFYFILASAAETESFKKFQLIPKDDSAADTEFTQFISKFKKDVKERNIESLKKSIAPDIVYSFEKTGLNGFLKTWKLDKNPDKSEFWEEMNKILMLGSAYYDDEKTSVAYPYLFVNFPSDYDSFEYAAVTGKKVNVRKSPSAKSPVVETLDYEIVKTASVDNVPQEVKIDGYTGRWVKVTTSSGREGYIFSRFIHSPIGFRAIFVKNGKRWMMTVFVSGD